MYFVLVHVIRVPRGNQDVLGHARILVKFSSAIRVANLDLRTQPTVLNF